MAFPVRRGQVRLAEFYRNSITQTERKLRGKDYIQRAERMIDESFEIPLGMAQEVRNELMYLLGDQIRIELAKQLEKQKIESNYPSEDHGEESEGLLEDSLEIDHARNPRTGEETDILSVEFGKGVPYARNINKPEGEETIIEANNTAMLVPNRKDIEPEGAEDGPPMYFRKYEIAYPGQATFTKSVQAAMRKKKSMVKEAVERVTGQTFKKGQRSLKSMDGKYRYTTTGVIKYDVREKGRFKKL